MLIRNVQVDGTIVAVRIRDDKIQAISDFPTEKDQEYVIDGGGGALLPGLHDHHIHLNATAAALKSVKCGPSAVENSEQLAAALHAKDGNDWLRGFGYHASVAGEIDRDWLDVNGPDRPVRIQHRGGRMWVFNSRATELLDIDIPADGRLVDGDIALRAELESQRPDLKPVIDKLLSHGITGVTEVTPGNNCTDLTHYLERAKPLKLCIMGGPDLHKSGTRASEVGPLKIHNHDYNLPSLADLVATIADAHDHDRAVAIHCVTRAELMISLAAIEDAGVHPGDRIEHAAIADEAAIEWMKRLDLTVVTQPHFVAERGEAYLQEVDKDDLPNLWRLGSLADAGLKLAVGSDAPFGDFNPWQVMDSATERPAGLSPDEAVSPEQALELYMKPEGDAGAAPRRIEPGAPADLCLLDRNWTDARCDLASVNVRATWTGGELVYDTISSTRPQSNAV